MVITVTSVITIIKKIIASKAIIAAINSSIMIKFFSFFIKTPPTLILI